MDILYYSNYCKHSQKVVQTLVKGNLQDKLSFVCIDTRKRDPQSGQTYILMENGSKVVMPPNVHSVPALLLINQNLLRNIHNDIFFCGDGSITCWFHYVLSLSWYSIPILFFWNLRNPLWRPLGRRIHIYAPSCVLQVFWTVMLICFQFSKGFEIHPFCISLVSVAR